MSHYSLNVSGRFVLHAWEEDALAFDACSGDTHLLEPLAAALVRYLALQAQSSDELLSRLEQEFLFPEDQLPRADVDATLQHLRGIGLIELAPLEDR